MTIPEPALGVTATAPESLAPSQGERTPRGYTPLLGFATYGIIVALLTPVFITLALKLREIAGPENQAAALGLVASVGAVFAVVVNPIAGRLSDRTTSRWGRRRPWILGGVVTGVGALVLIGLANNVWIVLIGWCLAQAGFNAASAAMNATIPDQVPVAKRGGVSAVVAICVPLGLLSGIAAVGLLPHGFLGFVGPGALAIIFAVPFALTLRDRRVTRAELPPFRFRDIFTALVFNPRKYPNFGWMWLNRFLLFFAYSGISSYLAYFIIDRFHATTAEVPPILLIATLCSSGAMMIASIVCGWISDKAQVRRPFVTIAGIIMVAGLIVIALAPNVGVFYVGQLLTGMGFGAYLAVDLALGTQVLPSQLDYAKDLGVLNIAQSLPQSIAPAIAPAIIAIGASTQLGGYAIWFLFGAVVALIGSFLVYRIRGVR